MGPFKLHVNKRSLYIYIPYLYTRLGHSLGLQVLTKITYILWTNYIEYPIFNFWDILYFQGYNLEAKLKLNLRNIRSPELEQGSYYQIILIKEKEFTEQERKKKGGGGFQYLIITNKKNNNNNRW